MVSFAKEGLLKNLDGYATAFGWDQWPVPQLSQNRVAADGTRGSGTRDLEPGPAEALLLQATGPT